MTRPSRLHLPAAALCVVLLVTGCRVAENPGAISAPGPTRSDISQTAAAKLMPGEGTFANAGDADRSDADSTAEVAALLLHSWDTLIDRTQTAAAVRAKDLMNEEWASHQVEPERNGAQGEWLKPSRHQAYSSPSVVPGAGDVAQEVAPDKAIRFYHVTWRWIARDGAELPDTSTHVVTLYLEKQDGLWSVAGHQIRELWSSMAVGQMDAIAGDAALNLLQRSALLNAYRGKDLFAVVGCFRHELTRFMCRTGHFWSLIMWPAKLTNEAALGFLDPLLTHKASERGGPPPGGMSASSPGWNATT